MDVWLARYDWWDVYSVYGVFATREAAIVACEASEDWATEPVSKAEGFGWIKCPDRKLNQQVLEEWEWRSITGEDWEEYPSFYVQRWRVQE